LIPHTKAFAVLKSEAQKVFDFAIVVSYAVPALKYALRDVEPGSPIPFAPGHFDSRPVSTEKVKHDATQYKALLSRYMFLSSFSFFEAYIHGVLKEILDFHGTEKILGRLDISKNHILSEDLNNTKQKRKLQEYQTAKDLQKYKSYGLKLADKGFRFPSALLSKYGLKFLIELINKDNIRAVDIPALIQEVLQLELNETEITMFHKYRNWRNEIAHGKCDNAILDLRKAVEANNFLRNLALKIDKHVIEYFLIVEAY